MTRLLPGLVCLLCLLVAWPAEAAIPVRPCLVSPVLAVQPEKTSPENQNTADQNAGQQDAEQQLPAPAAAAEPTAGQEGVNSGQAEEDLTPAEIERRKNFLSVAWMMLIGVVIVCLLLFLIVLYIGSSVRRIARKPAPQAPLRDLFWYLKTDSKTGVDSTDETPDGGNRSEP